MKYAIKYKTQNIQEKNIIYVLHIKYAESYSEFILYLCIDD